ncbi:PTS system mannose-specific EIIAB component [Paraliobacillus sp. PM-2]|uniref:PTS galactosamine/N-acetylgalactosamine transporter subunit IIA n=1 Tax=Paraliobacillus sp. PM-2 TaxID=1462524 RepID=UPI00061C0CA0|nr:PTS galactosamine/N-acetylgalactosamine transporter subunit IIA [Paraliobacillus sp. PM-2]CQR47131.1 PTS system mannose-specific EIIAB component [Paraliobacillus sp. PM-2]
MIGIVICGHGQFASGIYSSIQLIAGEQEHMKAIDFKEGMNVSQLKNELGLAIAEVEQGDGVVVFTDIPGGTPFNQSVILSIERKNVKVISGVNLPSLLDGMFSRELGLDQFVTQAIRAGEDGLQHYQSKEKQKVEREDGI